jgi:hypothetical protein
MMIGLLLLIAVVVATAFVSAREYRKGNTKKAFVLVCVSVAILTITTVLAYSLKHFGEAPRN